MINPDFNTALTVDVLRNWLRNGVVVIAFKKKSGEVRVMVCSTHPMYLEDRNEDPNSELPAMGSLFKVWDLEKKAWRSFNFDQITHVSAGGLVYYAVTSSQDNN